MEQIYRTTITVYFGTGKNRPLISTILSDVRDMIENFILKSNSEQLYDDVYSTTLSIKKGIRFSITASDTIKRQLFKTPRSSLDGLHALDEFLNRVSSINEKCSDGISVECAPIIIEM